MFQGSQLGNIGSFTRCGEFLFSFLGLFFLGADPKFLEAFGVALISR